MLQTIRKIGPVLDLFTIDRPEWGVAEVAEALDIARSSAHALLSSLAETGLLQMRGRGRYRIGWRVVELSETLRGTVDIRTHATPAMRKLVDTFGETTHLAVMEHGQVRYIEKLVGTHMVNIMGARVGARLAPHCSAVGKVLLANLDPVEVQRRIGEGPLRALTANTITDPVTLARELRTVRVAGFAYDSAEAVSEVHCVAAPIKDDIGEVIAAVSLTVPASRFLPQVAALKRGVLDAAADISSRIAEASTPRLDHVRDDPTGGVAG